MSALAQLLHQRGHEVSGSDREESPTTHMLAHKGVTVVIGHDQCNIPSECELIVYSDAVWADNAERRRAKEIGINEMSYFEALGVVSKDFRTIAVAGTHGKTTTTGMLAKILQFADKRPTAIVGSIVRDFGSNFLAGTSEILVVEACEYRDHLLRLNPEILVITNIELDHTDYFPDLEALKRTFNEAAKKVPMHGAIIANPYDPVVAAILGDVSAPIIDYTTQSVPRLPQPGDFNIENAQAAKAAARMAFPHLQEEYTDRALLDFKGSWRRFEYKGETPHGAVVYDDYAHHPTAVEKTIRAARELFPDRRIVVAFHPHLYSRTRSFMKEFARTLAQADGVVIAPIYPAREAPDPAVTNHVLAEATRDAGGSATALDSFDEIRDYLLNEAADALIITMGAGDIYKVAEQIAD